MATTVYNIETIELMDGTIIEAKPLKIKYLREFMELFNLIKETKDNESAIMITVACAVVAMKQYYPSISKTYELEDIADLQTVYKIIEVAAGIKIKGDDSVKEDASSSESGNTWEKLDLAKLEAEAFTLGIWKDFEELEMSLSMPELLTILENKRELDYQEKKFFAAIQGIDLDKQTGKDKENAWEKMKAKVFSGGKTDNPNDIVAYQGANASKAGFGIGMGLSYERID